MSATFRSNIGLIVMRLNRKAEARMCEDCIKKDFRQHMLVTSLLGWWSLLSLVVAPILLVLNTAEYYRARKELAALTVS